MSCSQDLTFLNINFKNTDDVYIVFCKFNFWRYELVGLGQIGILCAISGQVGSEILADRVTENGPILWLCPTVYYGIIDLPVPKVPVPHLVAPGPNEGIPYSRYPEATAPNENS